MNDFYTLSSKTNKLISDLILPIHHTTVSTNTQYIKNDLCSLAKSTSDSLLVRSDMGTGKTFALAELIEDHIANGVVLVVTHLRSLVKGNQKRIQAILASKRKKVRIAHYEESNAVNISDAQVIFVTFHSLHVVLKKLYRPISAIVFDESESVSQMMTAEIMNLRREFVTVALNKINNSTTTKLIMMDAHLGEFTQAFCAKYFPNKKWVMLENNYSRWKGMTYSWIKADDGNAELQGIQQVATLLENGKHVFVTTGSKAQAKRIHYTLKTLGILPERTLLAFDDDEEGVLKRCKDNHDKFNNFTLVIATPAVGTGISIEPRPKIGPSFDYVVSFMTRHVESPDAISALQMPFRVRATKSNHLYLIECDFQPHYNKAIPPYVLQADFETACNEYGKLIKQFPNDQDRLAIKNIVFSFYQAFEGAVTLVRNQLFINFFDIIDTELEMKGIKQLSDTTIEVTDTITCADKEARIQSKEEEKVALLQAPIITPDQAMKFEKKQQYQHLKEEEKLSLRKYHLLNNYAPDTKGQPTVEVIEMAQQRQKQKLMHGVNRISNAAMSVKTMHAIQRLWLLDDVRQIDATSTAPIRIKSERKIYSLALKAIGFDHSTGTFTNRKIDNKLMMNKPEGDRSIKTKMLEEIDAFNAVHPDCRINKAELKADPTKVLHIILTKHLKFKATCETAFLQSTVELKDEQPVLELLKLHQLRGPVGLAKINVDEMTTTEATTVEKPKRIEQIIRKAWELAGKPCSLSTVLEWLLPYKNDIMRKGGYTVEQLVKGIHSNVAAQF